MWKKYFVYFTKMHKNCQSAPTKGVGASDEPDHPRRDNRKEKAENRYQQSSTDPDRNLRHERDQRQLN
jgi:hypothetical protein